MEYCAVGRHEIFLDSEGNIWGSGDNSCAQLGQEPYLLDISEPVQLSIPAEIVSVYAASYQSYFVDTEGSVWTCGSNPFGMLGFPAKRSTIYKATKIENLPAIRKIYTSILCTIFQDYDGVLWICGKCAVFSCETHVPTPFKLDVIAKDLCIVENSVSWLLDEEGTLMSLSRCPGSVSLHRQTDRRYVAMTRTYSHNLLLDEDGNVWGYGSNLYGQCGNPRNSYGSLQAQHVQVAGIPVIQDIKTGEDFSVLLDIDGCVWTFGSADRLGRWAFTQDVHIPKKVEGLPKIRKIYCGFTIVAVDEEGSIWLLKTARKAMFFKPLGYPTVAVERKIATKSARNVV